MFLDPSLGVLWLCAISCLCYGSSRSYEFFKEVKQEAPQEIKFVQSSKIIFLPIIGSVVLLLLFFFLDFSITIYILIALISIVVFVSQFFVFAPFVDYIFERLFKEPKGIKVPKIGFIPASGIVLFLYSCGVVALWIGTGHWIVVDGIAWCLAITQMSILRLPSIKIATYLLVPFLIYDVFWVFISPLIFHGTSVMESVAVKLPPFPLLLKVPHFSNSDDFSGLGLGDIALPGFFIVYLYSFDQHVKRSEKIYWASLKNSYVGYFKLSLIEYTVGYIITILAGTIMERGQPALLYLVPLTLIPTVIIAKHRGDLSLMWQGHLNTQQPETDLEAQASLLKNAADEPLSTELLNQDNQTLHGEGEEEGTTSVSRT